MILQKAQHIFLIGIGGSGMSGLGYLLAANGKTVSGCDQDLNVTVLSSLRLVSEDLAATAVTKSQVVIHSDAVPADHPLLALAKEHSIPICSYQQALGEFAAQYTVLAVTGAHGKSSTTAFLAHILTETGLDPTALIGAPVIAWERRGARAGKSEYMVVEADEYREHFLTLRPKILVITTIDFDHPDFFASLDDVKALYKKFMEQVAEDGHVIVLESEYIKYPASFWPDTTIRVDDAQAKQYVAPLPGEHMQTNVALAIEAATLVGISPEQSITALSSFAGLGRRFEKLGEVNGKLVISDYGHHPAEIAATLRGAKELFPGKSIVALFEAHMIERLETFFDEFVDALALAQSVVTCPVFYPAGREGSVNNLLPRLQAQLTARGVMCTILSDWNNLDSELTNQLQNHDVAIAFTAGVLDGKLRKIV